SLTQLEKLDLSFCESVTNFDSLRELIRLTQLDLSNCRLFAGLDVLAKLTQLTKLDLSGNKLLVNLKGLMGLTKLRELDLNECQSLTSLDAIAKLTQLNQLDVSDCESLTSLTGITGLTQLTQLNLMNCARIGNIESVATLTNLTWLRLDGVALDDIGFVPALHKLEYIDLDNNSITDITPLHTLSQLNTVLLQYNALVNVVQLQTLLECPTLEELQLYSNPFASHYGIKLEDGMDSRSVLRNLLFRIDDSHGKYIVLPSKVLLLGNHAAGKSSLAHYLTQGTLAHNGDSTHILQIKPYKKQADVRARKATHKASALPDALIYDFGGQDYYHGIYRVFMSQHALTCLLWHPQSDCNKVEKDSEKVMSRHFNRDYWLGYWQHYNALSSERTISTAQLTSPIDAAPFNAPPTGDAKKEANAEPAAPLLLIQTHADEEANLRPCDNPYVLNQHIVSLDSAQDTPLFSASLQYFQAQLDTLISQTQKTVAAALWYEKFLKMIFSEHKKSVKRHWQAKAVGELVALYNPSVSDLAQQLTHLKTELSQLHAQGMVLYYPSVNAEKVWLHPMSFAYYVHTKVLSKATLGEYKGVIPAQALRNIDQDIISVLEKEQVIFKHDYGDQAGEYIVPNYLPLTDDTQHDYHLLTFGVQRDFAFGLWFKAYLPLGLINQLICHFGNLPNYKKFWRDQLLFTLGVTEQGGKSQASQVLIKLIFTEQLQIKVFINNSDEYIRAAHSRYVYYVIMSLYNDGQPLQHVGEFEQYFAALSHGSAEKSATKYEDTLAAMKDKKPTEKALPHSFEKSDDTVAHAVEHLKALERIYVTPPQGLWVSVDERHYINALALSKINKETRLPCELITPVRAPSNKKQWLSLAPFKPFTHRRPSAMLKVFVSYSHDDIASRRELQQYLINLERDGIIELWQDGMINTGDDWHDTIVTALDDADVIIMLVSQSFIASSYVHSVEMPLALKNMARSQAKIFPILLSNCDYQDWQIMPTDVRTQLKEKQGMGNKKEAEGTQKTAATPVVMGKYQFFPQDEEAQRLKPLNRWQYPEDAWTQVTQQLRTLSTNTK
ncbi:TIR domain-containing protein, partial [Pseudoalteromonas aurantia]